MVSAVQQRTSSRVSDIAFCGLSIALMAVGAWVTVPLGPVPFTLQTFVIMLAVLVLTPKQSIIAVVGYVLLGAIGVPVFAGMSGGVGSIMGATGGFIWGFILGAVVAAVVRTAFAKTSLATAGGKGALAINIVTVLLFLLVVYTCGVAQLSVVASLTIPEALAVGVVPVLVTETAKTVAAVVIASAVNLALGKEE